MSIDCKPVAGDAPGGISRWLHQGLAHLRAAAMSVAELRAPALSFGGEDGWWSTVFSLLVMG